MSNTAQPESAEAAPDVGPLPTVTFEKPHVKADYASILGVLFAVGLITGAILIGQSNANFFDAPSLLIVVLGTMAATAISYTGEELGRTTKVIGKSLVRHVYKPSELAGTLIDLAVIAKKKGILALVNYDQETNKDSFLSYAVQMVVDGYDADEIEKLLVHEINTLLERHKRSASITRRAAEVAPAMGLIGTLVGLVQMLADLENPETIGPAMALALLTTFYGAIIGNIIMAPLAVKLEKNSADEALIKTLIKTACVSIARQENPRRLEMLLNAELPPSERIQYFD